MPPQKINLNPIIQMHDCRTVLKEKIKHGYIGWFCTTRSIQAPGLSTIFNVISVLHCFMKNPSWTWIHQLSRLCHNRKVDDLSNGIRSYFNAQILFLIVTLLICLSSFTSLVCPWTGCFHSFLVLRKPTTGLLILCLLVCAILQMHILLKLGQMSLKLRLRIAKFLASCRYKDCMYRMKVAVQERLYVF